MTENVNYLEQAGLVTDSINGRIKISLTGSGCSACHNSLCMLGDSKAKEVEISATKENWLFAGDEVIVKINPASGYKAVALLYILPFFLMILSLVIVSQSGYSEGIAGLTSLLILAPYFGFLFVLRNKLRSQCTIEVEKR
jgi:sigma-E factor negative regulatory protein RseC